MRALGTRPALARQRVSGAIKTRLASCKSPMLSGSRSRDGSVLAVSRRRVRPQMDRSRPCRRRTPALTRAGPTTPDMETDGAPGVECSAIVRLRSSWSCETKRRNHPLRNRDQAVDRAVAQNCKQKRSGTDTYSRVRQAGEEQREELHSKTDLESVHKSEAQRCAYSSGDKPIALGNHIDHESTEHRFLQYWSKKQTCHRSGYKGSEIGANPLPIPCLVVNGSQPLGNLSLVRKPGTD